MSRSSSSKGFTLIEIIVVMGIVGVLTLITTNFLTRSLKAYRVGRSLIVQQEKAASVMREFEFSVRALTQIASASEHELVFYRFFDLDSPDPKKVRFFLEGTTFKVGETDPVRVGELVNYPSENEQVTLLIENVSSLNLSYFDANETEITDLSTFGPIKMVGLSVEVDNKATESPEPTKASTMVNLRNKKSNL